VESVSFVTATQSSRQSFCMPSAIFTSDIPLDACECYGRYAARLVPRR
jgi:hypothetical protein